MIIKNCVKNILRKKINKIEKEFSTSLNKHYDVVISGEHYILLSNFL